MDAEKPVRFSEITSFAAWPHYECFVSVAVLVAVKPFREKTIYFILLRTDMIGAVKLWKLLSRKHRKQWQTK